MSFRSIDRDKFVCVADGRKTVETRAAGGKYEGVRPGDIVVFRCGSERLEKTVMAIRRFGSAEKVMAHYGIASVMPWARDMGEVEATYASFRGYSELIARHGLLAFELSS